MPVKCNKCGADIPDNAAFCPGCGAPKSAEQPTPEPATESQPIAAPPPAPAPKPVRQPVSSGAGFEGMIETFLSAKMILLGFFIGILVAWIARIVNQFIYSGDMAYQALNIVNFTFMAGVGGLLLCGGFLNNKLDKYIRVGLIVAGGLILAANL